MADRVDLDRLVDRVAGQVRQRRLEFYGLRGAFYGAVLALVPLLAKQGVGEYAPLIALALLLARASGGSTTPAGDLSAIFKDTAMSGARPDFNSFLKKGDERLKMLEQADRLPDLQSDFTQSQYKMMFQKSKSLTAGLRPDQISP